jgi:crotonobetainyl-CoA:carnitine CoA-transferase CaiB-like acyl-CoA transferase
MTGLLAGTKVLDFGRWIAGPYCAHLLAHLGADVVRIERPEGEDDRFLMPVTDNGEGAQFLQCNGGKRSLTLRMSTPEGRDVVRRLVAQADVVVANFSPGALKHFGLDYETLRTIKPDIILTTASAYPTDTEHADRIGYDGVGQAVSGAIWLTGEHGRRFRTATAPIDFSTALSCTYGTLGAIIGKLKTGKGAHVQASLVATSLNITNQILMEESTGFSHREQTGNRSPMSGPSDIFTASDGLFIMQVIGQKMFERWCRLVARTDLLADSRFASDAMRGQNGVELSAIMQAWSSTRPRDECIALLEKENIGCAPILSPAALVSGEMGLMASVMSQVAFPGSKGIPVARPPAQLTDGTIELSRPPLLGEHTDVVLADYGFSTSEIATLRSKGAI